MLQDERQNPLSRTTVYPNPIYRIEFSAMEELSYRRIHWWFGFTNLHALKTGQAGFACRGVEHELTVE